MLHPHFVDVRQAQHQLQTFSSLPSLHFALEPMLDKTELNSRKCWASPAGRLAELFTLSYSCPGSHTSSSAGDEWSSHGKNLQYDPTKMTLSDNLTVEIHFMYTTVWWPPSHLTCISDTFWFKFFFFLLAGLKCYNVHWSATHIWTQRQVMANEIREREREAWGACWGRNLRNANEKHCELSERFHSLSCCILCSMQRDGSKRLWVSLVWKGAALHLLHRCTPVAGGWFGLMLIRHRNNCED